MSFCDLSRSATNSAGLVTDIWKHEDIILGPASI